MADAEPPILERNMSTILCRMLYSPSGWGYTPTSWLSILGPRIQPGQTSVNVAANLVAVGYANLCGYNTKTNVLQLGFLPDPVPARLAMCMMDEDFEYTADFSKQVGKGRPNRWWAMRLTDIFSSGLVSPDNGNVGEVVVALYLLFCGDLLRKRFNNKDVPENGYKRFSVCLDAWLQLLQNGGKDSCLVDIGESNVSVGFIQVCQNDLRSYDRSWTSLANTSFLEHVYRSGVTRILPDI